MDQDADARAQIKLRLAETRAELRRLLDPPRAEPGPGGDGGGQNGFPRSHTMRALLSSRGVGALGALAGGLLIARPQLALRLLRLVPASAVIKMLVAKVLGGFKDGEAKP